MMRNRWLAAGALLLGILPVQVGAETLRLHGYDLRLEAQQEGEVLLLAGRVEGGTYCRMLRIETRLSNHRGEVKRLTLRVEEAGGIYSRLLDKRLKVKLPEQDWAIEQVDLRCEDRK